MSNDKNEIQKTEKPEPTVVTPKPKEGSFVDDLFSFAEEAVGLAREVKQKTSAEGVGRAKAMEDEPYDAAIVFVLRSLVTACKPVGGVRLLIENEQFRLIIGEGISMRVTEGPTLGGVIIRACEREGVSIDTSARGHRDGPDHG